jgi:hypothetical protein
VTEQPTFDQLLGEAQLPEDTVDICLRGDLVARYNTLQEQVAAMPDPPAGSGSLAGNTVKRDLVQQMEAVAAQMRRSTQTFTLRSLSDRAFSTFRDGHPPRPDDRRDMLVGYNRETLGPALIRECLVDPKPTPEQWDRMRDVISPGEWSKLDRAATGLNFAEISIPFSSAASPSPTSSGSE